VRAAVLLAIVAALATGCSSGFDATARQSYAPGDGIQAGSGDLRVLSALVVAPDDGSSGVVLMAVVNRGAQPDEITAVESDVGTVDYAGSKEIAAGETVRFGPESDPSAVINDLVVDPGETITLNITFAEAEPITLRTVIVPATGEYASVTAPSEPSATPTEPGSATPAESASPAPISSPSTT
jgi:hypothetical protein